METNQPGFTATPEQVTPPPVSQIPPARPSAGFNGKIPSSVAFAVGVLLFFMPFVDIKCNNMSLQQVSGLQLATGFKMKNNSSDNPYLNDVKTDKVDETITKTTTKTDDKGPNLYALIALGLGVLGLILSFVQARAAIGGAMVTGIASAAALIGMMIDIKNKAKFDMPTSTSGSSGDSSDSVTESMKGVADNIRITIDFTPWFYISVIAFLAAAVFCYMRMKSPRTT